MISAKQERVRVEAQDRADRIKTEQAGRDALAVKEAEERGRREAEQAATEKEAEAKRKKQAETNEIADGFTILNSFAERFGDHPDFFNIVQGIRAFLGEEE